MAPPHSSTSRRKALALFACGLAALLVPPTRAQQHESALTDGEVDKLRDTAYYPPDRILAFIGFLDQRTKDIDKLTTGKRQPGREDDIHDLIEQFNSIAETLEDNLDDYGQHHRDVRKALPRLIAAAERWGTSLRTPPDHEAYNISRKLALETLDDVREAAVKLLDDQKAWFQAHPPPKDDNGKPPPRS